MNSSLIEEVEFVTQTYPGEPALLVRKLVDEIKKLSTQLKQIHIAKNIGSQNGRSKLSLQQVLEIRALRTQGKTLKEIAGRFNITYNNVSLICSNKTWKLLG